MAQTLKASGAVTLVRGLVRKVIPPVPFEQRLVQVRAVLQEAREAGVGTIRICRRPSRCARTRSCGGAASSRRAS